MQSSNRNQSFGLKNIQYLESSEEKWLLLSCSTSILIHQYFALILQKMIEMLNYRNWVRKKCYFIRALVQILPLQ